MVGGEPMPSFTEGIAIVADGKIGGGCINGLLHFFGRRYFFFSGRNSHGQKQKRLLLLTGEKRVVEKTTELTRVIKQQHIQRNSLEPSSPSSSSSSSARSYKTPLLGPPAQPASPQTPTKPARPPPVPPPGPRDPRRFSCDAIDVLSRARPKIKELPRLSLGSREDSGLLLAADPDPLTAGGTRTPADPGSGKRRSNLVAKLMGLEPFSEGDPAGPVDPSPAALHVGPTSPFRPKVPAEAGPCRERGPGPNVFGEVEKRLADLDFRNSSRDLRALKQIVETIQRAKNNRPKGGDCMQLETKRQTGKIISQTRARQLKTCHGSLSRARPASASPSPPRAVKAVKKTLDSRGPRPKNTTAGPSGKRCVKRRLYPQAFEPETAGRMAEQKILGGVHRAGYSKITILPLIEGDGGPFKAAIAEKEDELVTVVKLAEVGTTTDVEIVDQPSPVSVLDSTMYGDELSSPLKTLPIGPGFRRNPSVRSLHSAARTHPIANFCAGDWEEGSSEVLEVGCSRPEVEADRRYVREILLASGLLHGDPDPDTDVVRLDPGLFRLLERTRMRRDGRGQLTAGVDRTAHRRLVFDVVGEIVASGSVRAPSGLCGAELEECVAVVCGEMEQMRARDADEGVCGGAAGRTEWGGEVSGVVLSIERLIFKDLVDEMVKGGGLGLGVVAAHGRVCRRLFSAVDRDLCGGR